MAKNKKQPPQLSQIKSQEKSLNLFIYTDRIEYLKPWFPAILVVVVFASYLPIWQNGFVWDDKPYILLNQLIQDFSISHIIDFFYGTNSFQLGNYHPFTMLSFALEYALAKDSAWLYHLNNLLLHTANSWLVYRLFKQLNQSWLVSVITAMLFALHPMHVESVAWAAARKDVLYTFFLLWSFLYYLRFDTTKETKFYFISILFFIASCLSKGMAVVLPALLLITDYLLLRKRVNLTLFLNKIPFFIISFFVAYLAIIAQKAAGADATSFIEGMYTNSEHLLICCYSFCFYWVKTILPINLLPFYPYPIKAATDSMPSIYTWAFVGVFFIIGFVYWLGRKDNRIWWAGLFFLISISTVLQIVPVGSAIVADRYYYLSSIGPLFMCGLVVNRYYQVSKLVIPLTILIGLLLGSMTFLQTNHWKNGLTLFEPGYRAYPKSPMVLANMGWYYIDNKDVDKAKGFLIEADNNQVQSGAVCRAIGKIYLEEGNPQEALRYFTKSYQFRPESLETDMLMGEAYIKLESWAKAMEYLEKYQGQTDKDIEYLTNLGLVYANVGKFKEAKEVLLKATQLQANFWEAHLNYAFVFKKEGNLQEAVRLLRLLYQKAPDHQATVQNLGALLVEQGKWQEAIEIWKKSAETQKDGSYEYNIAIQYATHQDVNTAKNWFIKSARQGYASAKEILTKNGVPY